MPDPLVAGSFSADFSINSVDYARALALQAASGWWLRLMHLRRSSVEPPPCKLQLPSLDTTKIAASRAFGAQLAACQVAVAVEKIGEFYTRALPAEHRSVYGIFYTPRPLVQRLLDSATREGIDWRTARVISPCCGAGAFLVEDASRMAAAMATADPAIVLASIGARLVGWDIDPFACWLSQLAVEAVLINHTIASGKRLVAITECRDSLMGDWKTHAGKFDLVNENPAFGKIKKSDALAARFARSQRGHLNTYGLFIDLALHLAREQAGIIAYLTPTSYLSGEYFSKLRSLLSSIARPASIDILESRDDVFPDVLQEVALSIFIRGRRYDSAPCFCVHAEPACLRIEAVGTLALPEPAGAPWVIARNPASVDIVSSMQRMSARLIDWGYRVKTGPLVPHKNTARMHAARAQGLVPVVWAESISSKGGRFTIRCDRPGRKAWYQPSGATDPNVTSTPALLLQRTTAKEQERRLIGAVMSADAIAKAGGRIAVENHVNMIVPCVAKPAVSLHDLASYFASEAADLAFRCISGSVAVSATELEALPLPPAADLRSALKSGDPRAALRCLYGVADGEKTHTKDTHQGRKAKERTRDAHRTSGPSATNAADSERCLFTARHNIPGRRGVST